VFGGYKKWRMITSYSQGGSPTYMTMTLKNQRTDSDTSLKFSRNLRTHQITFYRTVGSCENHEEFLEGFWKKKDPEVT
jgi:hypothetical protein